jgi:hypothetical protein
MVGGDRSDMKMAAMGVQMHSGWGALVVVANEDGRVNVMARKRIEVIDEKAGGKRQPYHRARNLALNEAEKYLARCAAESKRLATQSIRGLTEDLQKRGYRLANCAVLTASGRELPPLVRILAAHPLIHTAEGEFFRNAICSACEVLRLSVLRVREREIESVANTSLGRSAAAVMKQIANAGKSLGSPWTQDQKKAALAAWMALHEHKGGTLISRRWRR